MDGNTQNQTQDFYQPETDVVGEPGSSDMNSEPIRWNGSEFLHHQKSASWYMFAIMGVLITSLLLYVLTRDVFGPISVVIFGCLLLVVAGRKPRTVEYYVDGHSIVIGNKEYSYADFQSFSIVHEDQIESIALFPHKRFTPIVSLYFAPDDGQRIFDLLSDHIPFEQREKDQIDRFLHKIKF